MLTASCFCNWFLVLIWYSNSILTFYLHDIKHLFYLKSATQSRFIEQINRLCYIIVWKLKSYSCTCISMKFRNKWCQFLNLKIFSDWKRKALSKFFQTFCRLPTGKLTSWSFHVKTILRYHLSKNFLIQYIDIIVSHPFPDKVH